ncbi:MAG: PDZ domain-containing protein [Rhodanobacteraceae bacterium]
MKTNHTLKSRALIAALLFAVTAGALARADEIRTAGAAQSGVVTPDIPVRQRLQEDLRVVMLDLIQSGAFGDVAPEQIAIDLNEPAQRVSNLGVLVDSANAHSARDGLKVLAITPGGAAERMGLRAGDTLLAVNGRSLVDRGSDGSGRAEAASVLRGAVDQQRPGDALHLRIRRGGNVQPISGELATVYLPAMHLTVGDGVDVASAAPGATGMTAKYSASQSSKGDPASAIGCGRISVFDVAPRQRHLHAATLIAIDGQLPGPSGTKSFRIAAGSHTLKVAERIESRYLSFNDRLRNAASNYKTLTVDVEPNTTYFLAARLNVDKRTDWKNGEYWDPVIWQQSQESCR